jgi:hypothetical protein
MRSLFPSIKSETMKCQAMLEPIKSLLIHGTRIKMVAQIWGVDVTVAGNKMRALKEIGMVRRVGIGTGSVWRLRKFE